MIHLRPLMEKLALVAGGSTVAILMVEVGLRFAGISYPRLWTIDAYCGHAHRPGAAGWYREEGAANVRINSDGLRDREHTKLKPPNTFRVAVLGDGYTEAVQVPLEETFCSVLEKELGGCQRLAGRKVEVMNFGVSSYGTAQELLTLRHRVWDYSPDFVILAFCTENDVSESSPVLSGERQGNWRGPFFKLSGDALVVDYSFRQSPWYRVRRTWLWRLWERAGDISRVVQVVREALVHMNRLRWEASLRRVPGVPPVVVAAINAGSHDYKDPVDPVWQEAWQLTGRMLREMHNEVAQRGAGFLVVTLSNPIQVYPDPQVRKEFMEMTGVRDLFYPDEWAKEVGEREGFKVVNLAPGFREYADQNHVFLHGFNNTITGNGHWNAQGHRLAGKVIARELCREADLRSDSR